MTVREDIPLYICNICDTCYEIFDIEEFITHLKSDKHRKELFDMVPRDPSKGEPVHFCQVCKYPAYDDYNLIIHNKSEEHSRKLVEKEPTQEAEDCESRKRSPECGPFDEINMKRSLDRGKQ